jgi:3-methylfumaryl-CoA hydratase
MESSDQLPPDWPAFVGRSERVRDSLVGHRIEDLAALLDCEPADLGARGVVPPLAHWLYFNPWKPQAQLGLDGHPVRGGFMPPLALPRRMFASGRVTFHHDLGIGEDAEQIATIASIKQKNGAAGPLVFVTVAYAVVGERGTAITEERDIVYLPATNARSDRTPPATPGPPAPQDVWTQSVVPNPPFLFRFSALTSNTHRIHYDSPYARDVEGYPGLVVHGPLQAMLLLMLLRRNVPDRRIARFSFRARRPLFDTAPFLCVSERPDVESLAKMYTRDAGGHVCMSAEAVLADPRFDHRES